ncbi:MAG: hypothetical protein HQL29_01890 [Candidatus Omnitrophica bacterium]|nr:hypothetical protein [Candidatus Omnitrophota bacterium]
MSIGIRSLTTKALMNGDGKIMEYYKIAKEIWAEILVDESSRDIDKLGKTIHSRQWQFEVNCGGSDLGKEIMVISGFRTVLPEDISKNRLSEDDMECLDKYLDLRSAFENGSFCSGVKRLVRIIKKEIEKQ